METTGNAMLHGLALIHAMEADANSIPSLLKQLLSDGVMEQLSDEFNENVNYSPASCISSPWTMETPQFLSMNGSPSFEAKSNYSIGSKLCSPIRSTFSSPNDASQSPHSVDDASSPYFYGFLSGADMSDIGIASEIEDIARHSENATHPYLSILVQPAQRARFRYESEQGKHGSIVGFNNRYDDDTSSSDVDHQIREKCRIKMSKYESRQPAKSYPTVQLHNFDGDAKICCSLYQGGADRHSKHYHTLSYPKHAVKMVSSRSQYRAVFDGLSITNASKKSIETVIMDELELEFLRAKGRKSGPGDKRKLSMEAKRRAALVNLNKVCLRFDAKAFVNDKWISIGQPIYSKSINNSKSASSGELKITRASRVSGKAEGGDEVFLLVEKVAKSIEILFVELDKNGDIIWKAKGEFLPSDIHHQYGIVFKTPQYRHARLDNEVRVYMLLHRTDDGAISDPFEFIYINSIETLYEDWLRHIGVDTIRTDSAATELILSVDDVATGKSSPSLYFNSVLKEYAALVAIGNDDDDGKYPGLIEFLDKCKRQRILQQMNYLHIACAIDKPKLVELLLDNGVDPNRRNAHGDTPLHIAVNKENIKCLVTLLNASCTTEKAIGLKPVKLAEYNGHGLTAFHLAVIKNNREICEMLEAKDDRMHDQIEMYGGNTAIHIAAENNSMEVLTYLLQRNQIDVNSMNFSEHTAICLTHDAKVMDLLKTYGATDDHDHEVDEINELSETDGSDSESVGVDSEEIEISHSSKSTAAEQFERELELNDLFSAINLNNENSRDPIDANSLRRTERPFGRLSLTKLSNILNQDGKWENVANELGFDDYIERWQQQSDPAKHLIKFAEAVRSSKTKLREIFSKMNETDAVEIVNAELQHPENPLN